MKLKNSVYSANYKGEQIPVSVFGASGMVGQVFMWMLEKHPLFRVVSITAGEDRRGRSYRESVKWQLPVPFPESHGNRLFSTVEEVLAAPPPIVFSALPAALAGEIETQLAENGTAVFSNASAMRGKQHVPILIPEVNSEDLNRIEKQQWETGFIVTNANCATTGLATALAPLRSFGIKDVFVSTYQSVSGAGYPGVSHLDIAGNLIPHIENEEEKIKRELAAILHQNIPVYPSCVRVPVPFGHLETVWTALEGKVTASDLRESWATFHAPALLPSLPETPVHYLSDPLQPQPALSFTGSPPGMTVFIGRLKQQGERIGFTLLVNNIVRGAAGGAIANAELFLKQIGFY
ncbi:MAG: aspartate-semialdehyde dehydrogenase [Acidobacteria bacterium]|nr:aspartate-semialdehyde dehydrogenase [Acidobacteriota bacterium]